MFAGQQEKPRKDLQVLLRAWPEIRRRTGLRLTVAGADPLAVRLLLTHTRVPDEGIDVVGFLSQEELTDALLGAKALVAPSLGQESFGMVLTRAFVRAPGRRLGHPRVREVLEPDASIAVRRTTLVRSWTPSPRSSPTRSAAMRWVSTQGRSPSSATPGRGSRGASSRSTSR